MSDSYRPHGPQPTILLHPWDFLTIMDELISSQRGTGDLLKDSNQDPIFKRQSLIL